MAKKQSQLLKRLIAISLAAMITVGGMPAVAGGGFGFDTGITANAVDYTLVTTSEELQAAFETGGTYTLGNDLTWSLSTYPTVDTGKTVRLNLGGHTLSLGTEEIQSYGNLTIEGEGTIIGAPYWRMIRAYSGGVINLVSDDITYEYNKSNSECALLDATGTGTINVSGGNFVSATGIGRGDGTISITGGTFNKDVSNL